MDLKRLFQVLVVGGSVAAGCDRSRTRALVVADAAGAPDVVGVPEAGAPEAPVAVEDAAADIGAAADAAADMVAAADAAAEVAAADAAAAEVAAMDVGAIADATASTDAADGSMGSPCFCSPTKCCDSHEGAPATVQPGLYCCWSTKC